MTSAPRNPYRRTRILLAGLVLIIVAGVVGVIIVAPNDPAPATNAPVPVVVTDASDESASPTTTPVRECITEYGPARIELRDHGKLWGYLFVDRLRDGTTCGYIWMAGKYNGVDQQSITLTLCDGHCTDDEDSSESITAEGTFATQSVFLEVNNYLSFKASATTPEKEQLYAASDRPIPDL